MAYNFLAVERDQLYLMPPSVTDWLEEDHLAFFVLDAVDEMDLDLFYAKYRQDGCGAPAHDPKMMVALLVYAYCLGVRSSRQIERACHVDVAFRVVAANQTPDHTTIARFRQGHEAALKEVFSASLRLCARAGMAKVGLVAVDGTKMAAPASMQKNRTKDAIDEEVDKMFADAKATDAAEDAQFGDARGDEPPATLRGRADRKRRCASSSSGARGRRRPHDVTERQAHGSLSVFRQHPLQVQRREPDGAEPAIGATPWHLTRGRSGASGRWECGRLVSLL